MIQSRYSQQSLSELAHCRQMLLNKAYRGHVIVSEWLDLAACYRYNGYEFNAAWCMKKVCQFIR